MEIKWLKLYLGVFDFCPVCKQRVSVEITGLNVKNFPETIEFFCVDCGKWEVPVSVEEFLKEKEIRNGPDAY